MLIADVGCLTCDACRIKVVWGELCGVGRVALWPQRACLAMFAMVVGRLCSTVLQGRSYRFANALAGVAQCVWRLRSR